MCNNTTHAIYTFNNENTLCSSNDLSMTESTRHEFYDYNSNNIKRVSILQWFKRAAPAAYSVAIGGFVCMGDELTPEIILVVLI